MKTSTHKKEAWELIKYITGGEGEKMLAESGLVQPSLMKEAETTFLENHQDPQNKKMLLEAAKYVKYFPMCKNCRETSDFIGPELDKVWDGSETAKEAMVKLKLVLEKHPPQNQ